METMNKCTAMEDKLADLLLDPEAAPAKVKTHVAECESCRRELEEMRANLKMGEDDPALRGDLERAQAQFKGMLASVDEDLQRSWAAWDVSLDANDSAGKSKQKDAMVALLDRRSYLRNLLREVDSVLTPQVAGSMKVNI